MKIESSQPPLPPGANQEAIHFYQGFLGPAATPLEAYIFINNLNHFTASFMSTLNNMNQRANEEMKEAIEKHNAEISS